MKSGRQQVASRTFDTRREATAWVARERAALAGGVDPRAGRRTVRVLLPEWLEEREHAVSRKTYVADAALPRLMPPALAALQIGAVTDREVTRALVALNRVGPGRVVGAAVPRLAVVVLRLGGAGADDRGQPGDAAPGSRRVAGARTEMRPFAEDELESFYAGGRGSGRATGRRPAVAGVDGPALVGAARGAGP